MRIGVIIPALNEAGCVGEVVRRCLAHRRAGDSMRVVVCDNGSADDTGAVARSRGAEVVRETRRGYGAACLAGIAALGPWPDAYLFLDADGSSRPEEMERLLAPIRYKTAALVLGRRRPACGSMTLPQRWGTRLAVRLMQLRWGVRYDDLGPFRAIRREAYVRLEMSDPTWGWTIEMQINAILHRLRWREVEVSWERRLAGRSKISGTLLGVARAGTKIVWTVVRNSGRRPVYQSDRNRKAVNP